MLQNVQKTSTMLTSGYPFLPFREDPLLPYSSVSPVVVLDHRRGRLPG